jgi:hypothetical protein
VSKLLQNHPVQFSKVLPNPKFKRNLKMIFFFFLSWPDSSFQPCQPALSSPPYGPPPSPGPSPLPSLWAAFPAPPLGLNLSTGPASQPPPSHGHAGPARSSSSLDWHSQPLPSPPGAPSAPVMAGAPPPLITPHHHPGRSSRKICRKVPGTSNLHNFSTTTPNLMILSPNSWNHSLFLFVHSYNTCLLHFID